MWQSGWVVAPLWGKLCTVSDQDALRFGQVHGHALGGIPLDSSRFRSVPYVPACAQLLSHTILAQYVPVMERIMRDSAQDKQPVR